MFGVNFFLGILMITAGALAIREFLVRRAIDKEVAVAIRSVTTTVPGAAVLVVQSDPDWLELTVISNQFEGIPILKRIRTVLDALNEAYQNRAEPPMFLVDCVTVSEWTAHQVKTKAEDAKGA